MKIGISNYLYKYFVNYDKLNELISTSFTHINRENLNIYIDAASMLRTIITCDHQNSNMYSTSPTEITAGLINVCIHYKYYFMTRYNMIPNVYLITSYDGIFNEAKQYYPEYNSKYIKSVVYSNSLSSNIKENINLTNTIIPYLPNIYFVDSSDVESYIMIASMINNTDSSTANLIVSRDLLTTLTMYEYWDSTVVLYPDKDRDGNNTSITIGGPNYFRQFMSKYRPTYNLSEPIVPFQLAIIIALCGYDKKSIKCSLNITKTINAIKACKEKYNLLKVDKDDMINYLKEANIMPLESLNMIISTYLAIDVYTQMAVFNCNPRSKINYNIDLYDPDAIKELNNKYFQKTPLNINML